MSRLFIFLLGVLVGAAGVFFLLQDRLATTERVAGTAPVGELAAPVSAPSMNVERPPLPAVFGEKVLDMDPVSMEPLASPPATIQPDTATPLQPAAPMPVPAASLLIPVQGIKSEQLTDTYTQSRGEGRSHDAIDIMAARGTPVLAVDAGRVVKLFNSVPGGLTVYQFDRDEKFAYYYAHLDSYAPAVVEGAVLKRGDLVGYVGSTGNANAAAPHLHFAIFVLGPEKNWWKGTAINPYPLLGGRPVAVAAK